MVVTCVPWQGTPVELPVPPTLPPVPPVLPPAPLAPEAPEVPELAPTPAVPLAAGLGPPCSPMVVVQPAPKRAPVATATVMAPSSAENRARCFMNFSPRVGGVPPGLPSGLRGQARTV